MKLLAFFLHHITIHVEVNIIIIIVKAPDLVFSFLSESQIYFFVFFASNFLLTNLKWNLVLLGIRRGSQ